MHKRNPIVIYTACIVLFLLLAVVNCDSPRTSDKKNTNKNPAPQKVVYKDKMYLIGGSDDDGKKKDVWSSTNGKKWTKETTTGDIFSAREGHQVVVFNEKMYLIGGYDNNSSSYKNDVWSSDDGVKWTEVTTTGTKFFNRYDHQVVVFDKKMYLIGGFTGADGKNDVWSSTNGKKWTEVIASAWEERPNQFSAREDHRVVVFDKKMYLIGGDAGAGGKNDVWSSTNGKKWTEVTTTSTKFSAREKHQVVVFPAEEPAEE